MKKIGIIYWSGTGNTEAMANAIAEGVQAAGGEADLMGPSEFGTDKIGAYDALAFGCPAMGSEELEETEVAPMWESVCGSLGSKTVALFGSYGWGDGEWMRNWQASCDAEETLICLETPDAGKLEECRALGQRLAG